MREVTPRRSHSWSVAMGTPCLGLLLTVWAVLFSLVATSAPEAGAWRQAEAWS